MAKPFSIQAPEDIAKEYAGNKQKIAQAAQMGIVDPTAAVLAGMFIDRMRSAQVMEAAQQPTVAQQVLGGGGLPTPAGPGAMATLTPPSPPMQAPTGAPPAPPMGMADGGLAGLPVPDTMFDEPTNGGFDDGYAGGGLVAFANGGATPTNWGAYIEEVVRGLDPNIQISGRARTPARNAEVGGVAGSYHLIDAARDIRTPEGMSKSEFIAQLKSVFGPDYDILPSKGASVHIEPGPKLGEKVRAGAAPSNLPAEMPERNFGTAEGRARSVEDEFARFQKMFAPTPEEAEIEEARMARAKEMASDEYYEKQRKDSMWETLANIGFNMASSKSPYLLQAVGEAAAAAMPGARVDKKERKALKDRALDVMQEMNNLKRTKNMQLLNLAIDSAKTGMQQKQFEAKLALDERQVKVAEDRLKAEIDAAAKAGADPEKVAVSYILNYGEGTPQYEAAKRYYELRYGERGGGASGTDAKAKLEELRGQQGGGTEGAVAKDNDGNTIVFSGGQWVYP